jgi:hypothetical protein
MNVARPVSNRAVQESISLIRESFFEDGNPTDHHDACASYDSGEEQNFKEAEKQYSRILKHRVSSSSFFRSNSDSIRWLGTISKRRLDRERRALPVLDSILTGV